MAGEAEPDADGLDNSYDADGAREVGLHGDASDCMDADRMEGQREEEQDEQGQGITAPSINGWRPAGLSGGGGMFAPAISGLDPNLMMMSCDMSGAYVTTDV